MGGLLNSFDLIFRKPNLAKKGKKTYTVQLKKLFAVLKVFQAKLDSIVEGVSDEHFEFWATYQNTRVVPKLGVHKTSFMLLVLDALTNKGKPNVLIHIWLKGEPQLAKNIKKSGKKGRINIRTLPEGEYVYEIVYLSYKTLTGSFFIHQGEFTKLQVVMEKER